VQAAARAWGALRIGLLFSPPTEIKEKDAGQQRHSG
jgi:hypothetical protein